MHRSDSKSFNRRALSPFQFTDSISTTGVVSRGKRLGRKTFAAWFTENPRKYLNIVRPVVSACAALCPMSNEETMVSPSLNPKIVIRSHCSFFARSQIAKDLLSEQIASRECQMSIFYISRHFILETTTAAGINLENTSATIMPVVFWISGYVAQDIFFIRYIPMFDV